MTITAEIVRELLNYDPGSGVFTWKARGREWCQSDRSWKWWNTRFAGKEAGCVDTDASGYSRRVIKLMNKNHHASRLAFLWMGEELPEQVDHIDGDSLNQAWSNLHQRQERFHRASWEEAIRASGGGMKFGCNDLAKLDVDGNRMKGVLTKLPRKPRKRMEPQPSSMKTLIKKYSVGRTKYVETRREMIAETGTTPEPMDVIRRIKNQRKKR